MKNLLTKFYVLFFVSIICYGLTGCVADRKHATDDTHELTLKTAVNSVLVNNPTYKTARKNLVRANSEYFKSISSRFNANLNTSENTFNKILGVLDKQVETHGQEYAYNNIKEILIEDTVLTYYKILKYRSGSQINLGDLIFYKVTIEDAAKKNNISSDKLSDYKIAEKSVEVKLEENKTMMRINKEKLANLGLTELVLNSNTKFAPINFTGNAQIPSEDYYIRLNKELNADKKLQREFIDIVESSSTISRGKCLKTSAGSLPDKLVSKNYNQLKSSAVKLKKAAEILKERRSRRDHVRKEYNDGKVDLLSLNHAQNELIGSESDYVTSCIDFMKAKSILNFTVGKFSY
ncbi:MAG TPA: hypothetical protein QF753_20660 [Victivallales bacterium]|nr:hypothetical protein [Victivallales bacterium]